MTTHALPIHPHLTHPVTGQPLRAVFVSEKTGRVYWPLLGGNGEGGDGGDGGQGAGQGGGQSDGGGTATYTAPATQAELDRIVQDRLARATKQYGMTAEEAKAFKTRVEELENDLGSETDKAVKKARDEERTKALETTGPRLVRQAFRAEAKGVLSQDQLDGLLEDFNAKNYLTDDGDVDEAKVAARVKKLAGANGGNGNNGGGTGGGRPPRQLGQGNHQQSASKPGDQGRAMAQKRFGDKARQS